MAASRVQHQRVAGRDIEPDVVLPDGERSPAHDDQFIVIEYAIGVGAVAAADEKAARANLDAKRGDLDTHCGWEPADLKQSSPSPLHAGSTREKRSSNRST